MADKRASKSGVNLVKLFWSKFTHTFCKLNFSMSVQQILLVIKWSSLHKPRANMRQKKLRRDSPQGPILNKSRAFGKQDHNY